MDEIWQYADRARTQLGTADTPLISYTGLWLLLALVAPAAEGRAITEALGCPPEEAREVAEKLIAEAHPTVAAALGAWLADWVEPTTPLPVAVESLPNQETLDAWAAEHTRGLVQTLPVTVRPETMLLLATALVTTTKWSEQLRIEDDRLVLRKSLQAIVETSIGPVAVARPDSRDGVDVFSVIAAPEVPAEEVWVASLRSSSSTPRARSFTDLILTTSPTDTRGRSNASGASTSRTTHPSRTRSSSPRGCRPGAQMPPTNWTPRQASRRSLTASPRYYPT